MRIVEPPAWLMAMLKGRQVESESEWVFPTTTGPLRDPDNARADLRDAVKKTQWAGLHPTHSVTWSRPCSTRLG